MIDSTTVLAILAAILIVGVIMLGLIIGLKSRKPKLNIAKYQADWQSIETSIGDTNSTMQFAILQADKLLDKALKESGYKGKTMGERMTSASRIFSKPDNVWSAHKLRNKIAHEQNVNVNSKITSRALSFFKRALKDVGAL